MTAPYDAKCAECRWQHPQPYREDDCLTPSRGELGQTETQYMMRALGPCSPDAKLFEPKTTSASTPDSRAETMTSLKTRVK